MSDARPAGRGPFPVVVRSGTPAELVLDLPEPGDERLAVLARPDSSALVLGSTQDEGTIDVSIVEGDLPTIRRRSGGGAVLVRPGAQVWLDLFVPVNDRLADTDIGRAARFAGEIWIAALAGILGPASADLRAHVGPLQSTRWSSRLCFCGLGPGEVTLGGRKLVGLSQRRDRRGAWFFTMAHLQFDPVGLAALVRGLEASERAGLVTELEHTVTALELSAEQVEGALRAVLMSG